MYIPLLTFPWRRVLLDGMDTQTRGGDAYANYGISVTEGAVVVVRPDGHVGTMAPVDNYGIQHLESYFGAFLVPRRRDIRAESPVRVRL
jgi:phenol 2-monooxygenase